MPDHSKYRFFTQYKIALLWAFFILVLSVVPVPSRIIRFDFMGLFKIDKLAHFILYALLYLFVATGYIKRYKEGYKVKKLFWKSFLVSALYGIIIEIIQPLAHRSFDVLDMIANTLGCLGAWGLFRVILKKQYHLYHS